MTRCEFDQQYREYFEYHGNTIIERTVKQFDHVIRRDWLLFDTVEEAEEYFNDLGETVEAAACVC
jgi:hypothetical protein